MKLSFLDKNALTLGTEPTTISRVAAPYPNVRFTDSPTAPEQAAPTADDNPLSGHQHSAHFATPPDSAEVPHTASLGVFGEIQSPIAGSTPSRRADHRMSDASLPPSDGYPVSLNTSSNDGAYEAALDVLVALGRVPPTGTPTRIASDTQTDAANLATPTIELLARLFPNAAHISQDYTTQLVRQYTYNVAPWLDIGDPDRTFGLEICHEAFSSRDFVLNSLLDLALSTLDRNAIPRENFHSALADTLSLREHPIRGGLIAFVLQSVRYCVVTEPLAWHCQLSSHNLEAFNDAVLREDHVHTALALSWVILRINVAIGLLNSSEVPIPNALLADTSSPAPWLQERHWYDREPLRLCARALNYCFGAVPSPVQTWRDLVMALNVWYKSRPQYLEPMVDYEEEEHMFPTILFTNSTATLGNQLYHTAMMLLLQHRPRTERAGQGRSNVMSPLWHARRVCGIALHNNDCNGWDFSMVASFFVAATTMSYEPQQRLVLSSLEELTSLTRWNLNGLSDRLRQLWHPD
ncbi:Transcriptional regulatory pro-1 [Paramyrothecium foliicola]|nr:Transcriptional regulatory pro-1 [Paramyrothecium foliicola]